MPSAACASSTTNRAKSTLSRFEALRCLTHQAVAQLELRRKVAELHEMGRALDACAAALDIREHMARTNIARD